jgi:multiple sugar transport system substrate-binding protein
MGSDATLHSLAGQLRSGRIDRRRFMQGAAALGATATAISSALRVAPTRAQGATEVTFWTTYVANDLANVQAVVDGYNAQAQGHQVKLVQIPPAQVTDTTTLMTAVRGGTGPDLYLFDRFIVAQRAGDGLLQDLSSLGADQLMGNYVPFAAAESQFNGKVYCLPFDTDVRALYYNKGLLGADADKLDPANGPATWDTVAEAANKLNQQDGNGNYTQMGFVPWVNQGWHYTYGFAFGGTFMDYDNCSVTPDEQVIVDAFKWVQDYCVALDADKVNAFGSPSMQPGFDPAQHPFHIGKLGMQITGDWEIGQMELYAKDVDYGITWMPVPKAGDDSYTWAGGWSVVIPTGAKHVDEAWTAMQWICGADGGRIYTQKSSHVPVYAALYEEKDLFSERHQFFLQLIPTAKNRPPLPVGLKYWDELSAAWQKNYLGQGQPADLLKAVKDRVNGDLQRFCPVTAPTSSFGNVEGSPAASPMASPSS